MGGVSGLKTKRVNRKQTAFQDFLRVVIRIYVYREIAVAVCHSNRSLCHCKMALNTYLSAPESFSASEDDPTHQEQPPSFPKPKSRRRPRQPRLEPQPLHLPIQRPNNAILFLGSLLHGLQSLQRLVPLHNRHVSLSSARPPDTHSRCVPPPRRSASSPHCPSRPILVSARVPVEAAGVYRSVATDTPTLMIAYTGENPGLPVGAPQGPSHQADRNASPAVAIPQTGRMNEALPTNV